MDVAVALKCTKRNRKAEKEKEGNEEKKDKKKPVSVQYISNGYSFPIRSQIYK